MAYEANILSAVTTQTSGSLLAIGAAWTFTVSVPGTLPTSCAIVTAQDASLLSVAPVVSVAKDSVTVKITVALSLASGAAKSFNIKVLV